MTDTGNGNTGCTGVTGWERRNTRREIAENKTANSSERKEARILPDHWQKHNGWRERKEISARTLRGGTSKREYPNDIRGNEHREGFRSGAPVERSLCSLEMGERANALEIENQAARGGTPRVIGNTEEQ